MHGSKETLILASERDKAIARSKKRYISSPTGILIAAQRACRSTPQRTCHMLQTILICHIFSNSLACMAREERLVARYRAGESSPSRHKAGESSPSSPLASHSPGAPERSLAIREERMAARYRMDNNRSAQPTLASAKEEGGTREERMAARYRPENVSASTTPSDVHVENKMRQDRLVARYEAASPRSPVSPSPGKKGVSLGLHQDRMLSRIL